MQNVHMAVEGNILTIKVDLSKEKVGLNVYRKK